MTGIEDVLSSVQLSEHLLGLQKLGANELKDVLELQLADFEELGLTRVQARRLQRAVLQVVHPDKLLGGYLQEKAATSLVDPLKTYFKKLDKNGDGTLTRQELREVFNDWDDLLFDTLLIACAKDKADVITYEDFVEWVMKTEDAVDDLQSQIDAVMVQGLNQEVAPQSRRSRPKVLTLDSDSDETKKNKAAAASNDQIGDGVLVPKLQRENSSRTRRCVRVTSNVTTDSDDDKKKKTAAGSNDHTGEGAAMPRMQRENSSRSRRSVLVSISEPNSTIDDDTKKNAADSRDGGCNEEMIPVTPSSRSRYRRSCLAASFELGGDNDGCNSEEMIPTSPSTRSRNRRSVRVASWESDDGQLVGSVPVTPSSRSRYRPSVLAVIASQELQAISKTADQDSDKKNKPPMPASASNDGCDGEDNESDDAYVMKRVPSRSRYRPSVLAANFMPDNDSDNDKNKKGAIVSHDGGDVENNYSPASPLMKRTLSRSRYWASVAAKNEPDVDSDDDKTKEAAAASKLQGSARQFQNGGEGVNQEKVAKKSVSYDLDYDSDELEQALIELDKKKIPAVASHDGCDSEEMRKANSSPRRSCFRR